MRNKREIKDIYTKHGFRRPGEDLYAVALEHVQKDILSILSKGGLMKRAHRQYIRDLVLRLNPEALTAKGYEQRVREICRKLERCISSIRLPKGIELETLYYIIEGMERDLIRVLPEKMSDYDFLTMEELREVYYD